VALSVENFLVSTILFDEEREADLFELKVLSRWLTLFAWVPISFIGEKTYI